MSSLTDLFGDIAEAIRDKTEATEQIVASNFPTAIDEIVSIHDIAKNASGNDIVTISDGAEYPLQNMVVQMEDGVTQTEVEVTVCGKNIMPTTKEKYTFVSPYYTIKVPVGCTLSVKNIGYDNSLNGLAIGFQSARNGGSGTILLSVNSSNGVISTIKDSISNKDTAYEYLIIYIDNRAKFNNIFTMFELQCEVSDTATEYEPYQAIQTATIDTDTQTGWESLRTYNGVTNVISNVSAGMSIDYYGATENLPLAYGDVTEADVLPNKIFSNSHGVGLVGAMPSNGNASTSIAGGVLKQGYTDGGAIANLESSNILSGVNIGGVVGNVKPCEDITVYVTDPTYPYVAPSPIKAIIYASSSSPYATHTITLVNENCVLRVLEGRWNTLLHYDFSSPVSINFLKNDSSNYLTLSADHKTITRFGTGQLPRVTVLY